MKGVKLVTVAAVMAAVFLAPVIAGGKTEDVSAKKTLANKTIRVFGAFGGAEAAVFDEIVKAYNAKTGNNVVYENSPEFSTQILVQAEAGTPPDIAALPQPGLMKNFAARGFIKPLPASLIAKIDQNYAKAWKDLGSSDGKVYGVFHRVNAKSFVWYPKKAFEAKGYKVPKTWDELVALENRIVADGGVPWAIGFGAGGATGWVGTDWLEDVLLRTAGPDVYDKWVSHQIPFNDPAIVNAMKYLSDIYFNPKFVYGGSKNILTTEAGDSPKILFDNPPKAYLHRQGNFMTGWLPAYVQKDMANELGVFALPSIDPKWGTPILGGGDQFVVFNDRPEVLDFMNFLTTWEACSIWAKRGGALFPHKNQNFNDYGSQIDKDLAKILVDATVFRFDGSDMMPAEVGAGSFWTGMVEFVSGTKAETVLANIEKSWPKK